MSEKRDYMALRRKNPVPFWGDLSLRFLVLFVLIGTVVLIHWLDRDGLVDNYDNHVSFLDVVYFTMISITTTGFGDIAPVSDRSRLFEAVIVTPIRIAVLFIFIGTAYQYVIRRSWETFVMKRLQKQLDGHIVVCGFGVSGSEAVRELLARGTDASSIVVVERNADALELAEEMGCLILDADATRDETLMNVRVSRAASVIISAGRDDTSILIGLTVRHLAPDVPISMVVRAADNELLARQAGATQVINPVSFTALLLAGSVNGPHTADYLADLASVTGRVALTEHVVAMEDVGKAPCDLEGRMVLRIYRNGEPIGFWEEGARRLEEGDILVEVVPGLDAARA